MERNPHLLIEGCAIGCYAIGVEGRLHLHPRRVPPRPAHPRGAPSPRPTRPVISARTSSAAASTATCSCTAAPARTRPAKRRRSSSRSRASARSRGIKPPFPGGRGPLRLPDRGEQRRDALQRAADHHRAAPSGSRRSAPRRTAARSCSASAATSKKPGVYEATMNVTVRELIYDYARRHRERAAAEGGHSRRIVGARSCCRTRSTCRPASTRCRRPARCSDRPASSCMDDTTCMVWVGEEPAALLPSRVVRQVHAVPRRRRLAATSAATRSSAAKAR